jgi:defect-in-organelle-trafficking protein DotC
MRLPVFITVLSFLFLSACTSSRPQKTETLTDLQALKAKPLVANKDGKAGTSGIRLQALRDTAMSTAARSALAARAVIMNGTLDKQDRDLNAVFNFYSMMLEHNVLPPVLVEGRDSLNLANTETIRVADRTFKIVSQARFVTTVPNWREYLWMDYQVPEVPNNVLLPKNREEKALWDQYTKAGWEQGLRQADMIYAENLARLKRDYAGMVLYRKLLAQKMVSPPFVSKTELGVTGGGSDMRVNDQVLRITALPQLRPESKTWKAVPFRRHISE